MHPHNSLNIVFCTADITQAMNMVSGIREMLPTYHLKFSAFVMNTLKSKATLSWETGINIIQTTDATFPIYISRNICQKFLQQQLQEVGGIGLILDDDLEWTMAETDFRKLISQLLRRNCDVAFITLSGDPPIPKEYTRACPLLDVLLGINTAKFTSHKLTDFLSEVTVNQHTTSAHPAYWHHDFYSYEKSNFHASRINLTDICFENFVEKLKIGKATTRTVLTTNDITSATGRERGGATIVINPITLTYNHLSLVYNTYHSRRSDMLAAMQLHNANFSLFNTPAILKHVRKANAFTPDYTMEKLVGDILGYALIESYNGKTCDITKFSQVGKMRADKTMQIVRDTARMLKILKHYINQINCMTKKTDTYIRNMHMECEIAETILTTINFGEMDKSLQVVNEQLLNTQLVSTLMHADNLNPTSKIEFQFAD